MCRYHLSKISFARSQARQTLTNYKYKESKEDELYLGWSMIILRRFELNPLSSEVTRVEGRVDSKDRDRMHGDPIGINSISGNLQSE